MRIFSFIATGFGSGHLPKMPGTWGSVVGLFLSYFCLLFFSSFFSFLLILSVVFFVGIISSFFVLQDSNEKDPSHIVIDEIIGIMLPIFVLHYFYPHISFLWGYFCPFFVFRFFDIVKPFPINATEAYFLSSSKKIMHSFGIMLDDVVAGGITAFVLSIVYPFSFWFY